MGIIKIQLLMQMRSLQKYLLKNWNKSQLKLRNSVIKIYPYKLTEHEKADYKNAEAYHLWIRISWRRNKRQSPDHLTDQNNGASHEDCNLAYQNPAFLPIYFHNLGCYNICLFINELEYNQENFDAIPNNKQKYISFSTDENYGLKFRFFDTSNLWEVV